MSVANVKTKSTRAGSPRLDRQITQAKAVLRQLRDTLEDLDDRQAAPVVGRDAAGAQVEERPVILGPQPNLL